MSIATDSTSDDVEITRQGGSAACPATFQSLGRLSPPSRDEAAWPHGKHVWTEPAPEFPAFVPDPVTPITGSLEVVAARPQRGRHRRSVSASVWSRAWAWTRQDFADAFTATRPTADSVRDRAVAR